jgi:hypothetical protein
VKNFITDIDKDQSVKFTQETDRIYGNVPTEIIKININDESNETFLLQRINLKDTGTLYIYIFFFLKKKNC